jgi:alkylation response protein AidB-like acyl-CoA dehydrogenase
MSIMHSLIDEREIAFLLYEFLDTEALLERPRYADHSRHVFDASLDAARQVASDFFAPYNAWGDQCEPKFEEGRASVIPETANAWRQFAEAGFLRAHWEEAEGGLQLPEVVLRAALALFFAANVASSGYPFLTIGAANLLRTFGTDQQKQRFLEALGNGRFSGTMGLTEPSQGSALGDIKTVAVPQSDGTYRLWSEDVHLRRRSELHRKHCAHGSCTDRGGAGWR